MQLHKKTSSNQNSPKKEVTEGNGASTNKVSPKENQKIEAIKIEHEQEATSVAAQPKKQTPKKAEPKVDNVKSSKLIQPVAGKISAPFGLAFSQFYQDYRLHSGIDIKVKSGTSVKAALHGTILEINKSNQDNITITIDHGQGLVTTYAHLGKSKVEKGDLVQQGQTIGIIDNPGLTEEGQGSHLHFEVRENKKLVNPEEYLK
ncbi:Peptidase family M23 [Desulfonispora thiosulfatigenes DSM 11270]|uniref:Peptidase family M23 n=1 Tax=Desulfonispora thiosulfatigenes DSM 11270 TaxID=656914 RepID=A0A1W1V4Z1_DESTI|nr:M23 family metallopeptidase [Desulfonispora thiosulfatigenes]SMB88240.1 Peptidase family M23 [Desulfonispora thiosulfatigenes DSM 11270]